MDLVAIEEGIPMIVSPSAGLVVLLGVMPAVFVGCSAVSRAPEVSPDLVCEHHLAKLGQAIAAWQKENGRALHSITRVGRFAHSWRSLIAPYLMGGDSGCWDYRFDQPWDSPHNRQQFAKWVPCKLTCPLESDRIDHPFTSYVMLLRGDLGNPREVSHETPPLPDDAILIVESVGCGIEYGEPRDVSIATLFAGESPFGIGKLHSRHARVVKALRVDGKVIDIPKDISKEELRKLLNGTPTNGDTGRR